MMNEQPAQSLAPLIAENLSLFHCPICRGDLAIDDDTLACAACDHHFPSEAGMPLLFWPNEWSDPRQDVTDVVKAFYEENPFPNYDDLDSAESLRRKAN